MTYWRERQGDSSLELKGEELNSKYQIPEGVLNEDLHRELFGLNAIQRISGIDPVIGGSSIDLHLSSEGWELDGSVKLVPEDLSSETKIEEVLEGVGGKKFSIGDDGKSLETEKAYLIRLDETINFKKFPWLIGEATGKSSIGRLDVLTRLLANESTSFDIVPSRYEGNLYVEVIPISFPIKVIPGVSLNQLRIHCGPIRPLGPTSLIGRRMLFQKIGGISEFADCAQEESCLHLDLTPAPRCGDTVAYKAKDQKEPIDLEKEDGYYNPVGYFEQLEADPPKLLKIKPGSFYIFRSIERLAIPDDIAVTGKAYTENLGEVRIHYAGFAHPWFGMERKDKEIGTPLIFEVRAHTVPVILRHGEKFASINFYKMAQSVPKRELKDEPEDNPYNDQELKLSKYFSHFPEK